ncbi:amidohydrolase family protein [Subtercola lobariae]|uniref:Cytosine deaminase n=1 Tax=Subtercola lobariae TaxID=1588641 RepID=A0A917BEV1_9MICO|nr:amidohydrolase family protein [Subtercola lobariae]GGF38371.1 cytosine deaminase [Subtercola lobariae]
MSRLPVALHHLTNATLPDGSTCDVTIENGIVTAVSPSTAASATTAVSPTTAASATTVTTGIPGALTTSATHATPAPALTDGTLDLTGFVLLTAPAEPHAHLDKALSWDAINPPMGDLVSAIVAWREYAQAMTTESIAERAHAAALLMLRQGTTAIRSHVDVLLGDEPLRGVKALVEVRDALRGLIDIELVALANSDSPDADIEAAIDLGVDLVGGAPHLAPDPSADLQRLLRIAERKGVGVDIHTDEGLGGPLTLGELSLSVRDWPADRNRSAGHCVRLGTLEAAELSEVLIEVKRSDVGIISLPITNLYLQGWEHPVATPRGLTAIRALLDANIRFAAGADNVRDPFNPVGRSDALETASLLVTAGHLTLDEAYTAVSDGAREVLALPEAGVKVGAAAELLAVRGSSLSDVIANASADRYVIHAGNLVAQSSVSYDVAEPSLLHHPSLVETR